VLVTVSVMALARMLAVVAEASKDVDGGGRSKCCDRQQEPVTWEQKPWEPAQGGPVEQERWGLGQLAGRPGVAVSKMVQRSAGLEDGKK
jgi:hypothetical protein